MPGSERRTGGMPCSARSNSPAKRSSCSECSIRFCSSRAFRKRWINPANFRRHLPMAQCIAHRHARYPDSGSERVVLRRALLATCAVGLRRSPCGTGREWVARRAYSGTMFVGLGSGGRHPRHVGHLAGRLPAVGRDHMQDRNRDRRTTPRSDRLGSGRRIGVLVGARTAACSA